jgi:hypothetical protein
MSTVVMFPLAEFNEAFDATCARLDLLTELSRLNKHIASALEIAAIEELHRAFIYEVRTLQQRIARGSK